jgi:hypothetical protein
MKKPSATAITGTAAQVAATAVTGAARPKPTATASALATTPGAARKKITGAPPANALNTEPVGVMAGSHAPFAEWSQKQFLLDVMQSMSMTRAALADRIGVKEKTVNNWMEPEGTRGHRQLHLMARKYIEDILRWDDKSP